MELNLRLSEVPVTEPVNGFLGRRVRHHRDELHEVLDRYGLSNARVFGSVARGEEDCESDVDLLVDVPEGLGLVTLGRCQAELEQLLGARVDLVPASDLKVGVAAPPVRRGGGALSRRDRQRLGDVLAAIDAIRVHLGRGDLDDGLVFDAVRVRLIEIGEAVKALPVKLLASEPSLPWAQIAGMRDRLAHRYFDTSHAILAATVSEDLPELETAVRRLLQVANDDT